MGGTLKKGRAMDQLPLLTLELLVKCMLIALILERALSVAFTDPAIAIELTKLPQIISLPLSSRFSSLPKLPFQEAVTLSCAIYLCQALSLHLVASFQMGAFVPDADNVVSALFITGLVQLIRRIFSLLPSDTKVIPASSANPLADSSLFNASQEEGSAVATVAKPRPFKLGGLQMKVDNT